MEGIIRNWLMASLRRRRTWTRQLTLTMENLIVETVMKSRVKIKTTSLSDLKRL